MKEGPPVRRGSSFPSPVARSSIIHELLWNGGDKRETGGPLCGDLGARRDIDETHAVATGYNRSE